MVSKSLYSARRTSNVVEHRRRFGVGRQRILSWNLSSRLADLPMGYRSKTATSSCRRFPVLGSRRGELFRIIKLLMDN